MQIVTVGIILMFAAESYLAVPYGFLGVRGKKSTADDHVAIPYDSADLDNTYKLEDERALVNYLLREYGRQNYPQTNQWDDSYKYDKRVPYGFMGMRGKRSPDQHDKQGVTADQPSNEVKQNQY